jgi:hypothetical protein
MKDRLADFAELIESAFDAWSRGEEPVMPAAPEVSGPVERARLARSLAKLAEWPRRAWGLGQRLGLAEPVGRGEAAPLLRAACRALAAGVARLEKDPEGAAHAAAEARTAATAVERMRREAGKSSPEGAVDSIKQDSFLKAYSSAADAVERAAVDLAAAAAAVPRG